YEESYLRDVGSKLWKRLSDALNERVTKNNLKSSISRYLVNHPTTDLEPAYLDKSYFERLSSTFPEFPAGPVPLSSQYYVARPPIEQHAYIEVTKPGALIRIKGPRKTGKNSLMLRILSYSATLQYRTVWLDFQQADEDVFFNLDRFLRWFATLISRRLSLEPRLDDYWDTPSGSKVSCTLYLQEYVLPQSDVPLVLALNEVNRIFKHQAIAQELLPLLRSWYEEAKQVEQFQKLRLLVVHSTEEYLNLSIHQSPFNVGLSIHLPEFDINQIKELAQRHGFNWQIDNHANDLMALVGGHPYLIRLALYHLCQEEVSLGQLLNEAATPSGIYQAHLSEMFNQLRSQPDLLSAVSQIIATDGNVYFETDIIYKLENLGIVKRVGDRIIMRNNLYRIYLEAQLFNLEHHQMPIAAARPDFALGQRVKLEDGRFAYVVGLAIDPTAHSWEYCVLPIVNIDDYDEMIWCSAEELSIPEVSTS
ncbi:MAG TPA: AAA-like domain-containing protein, partial [Elainellaceae cyanobacterium]